MNLKEEKDKQYQKSVGNLNLQFATFSLYLFLMYVFTFFIFIMNKHFFFGVHA